MNQRPVNMDLGSLTYPPMAIASILHRISGVALFVLLPFMMNYFSCSLMSDSTFNALQSHMNCLLTKGVVWSFCVALLYHVLAGIRHLLMDVGLGDELILARRSALIVIYTAVLGSIFLGVWIW